MTHRSRVEGRGGAWRAPIAALLCLAVAACTPAPSPSGSAAASEAPTPSARASVPAASGASVDGASLADALRDAIDIGAIRADLATLQALAEDGRRDAGSAGYDASAEFVAAELREAGYTVELQPVDVPHFSQSGPSSLGLVDGAAFEDIRDFKAMLFSASGDVTGPIVSLGFDPLAAPGFPGGLGCEPAHFAGIPAGSIVLIQAPPCRRQDVVLNAQDAGAAALVMSFVDWTRDRVLRPTLIDPSTIRIPAIGSTHEVGVALHEAAAGDGRVRVAVQASTVQASDPNVIAESPGGDPAHVLMLGGHLDSVMDGPGINDNGTGTMTILEIARRLATLSGGPGTAGGGGWKVRVAFWSGEELGFFGSFAYTTALGPDADAIEAYLNFDMLGSSNGVREVYSGELSSDPDAAATISSLFGQAFDDAGLGWRPIAVGAASDHFPFEQIGVPTGGLFSGASEIKTIEQAELFGGTVNAPNDPCYHLACDTTDNIDIELLEQMARAAGWVTGMLASGEATPGEATPGAT